MNGGKVRVNDFEERLGVGGGHSLTSENGSSELLEWKVGEI